MLVEQHADLQTRAQTLENETKTLSQENQQLRKQSAALLAARVVQEHSQKQAAKLAKPENSFHLSDDNIVPVLHQSQSTTLHSLGRTLPSSGVEEEEWETITVQAQAPARAEEIRLQTPQDLPEIKVAPATPQEELFDGEDFLEKTDSFIGRMKWSIFRENR